MSSDLDVERDLMRTVFLAAADERANDLDGATDPRYAKAAANLRLLAATMQSVDDATMLQFEMMREETHRTGAGLLDVIYDIGFDREPFADASAFFRSLIGDDDVGRSINN